MTIVQSLTSFMLTAGLLTITPGLDNALVLRTGTTEGSGPALRASLGITCGCLLWGGAVAVGLGAVLAASAVAFSALKWAGVAYLLWLGGNMLLRPRAEFSIGPVADAHRARRKLGSFWTGVLQNLLNPKIGVFYISFLPQFVPQGVPPTGYTFLLAVIHGLIGLAWFAALILATQPLLRLLRRPSVIKAIDRVTGCVFVAFGAKLALIER